MSQRVQLFGDHVERLRTSDQEREMMAAARDAGCAPPFEVLPPGSAMVVPLLTISMPRLTPLADWLEAAAPSQRRAQALSLLDCVERLHALGICHRDLHIRNVVLEGALPLLVDFELALRTPATDPCYDLIGPASGVPVPHQHDFLRITEGVWWDTPTTSTRVRPIWRDLGRLEEVRAQR